MKSRGQNRIVCGFTGNEGHGMILSPAQLAGQILHIHSSSCTESSLFIGFIRDLFKTIIAVYIHCTEERCAWTRDSEGYETPWVSCQEIKATLVILKDSRSKNCRASLKATSCLYGYDWKLHMSSSWLCHVTASEIKRYWAPQQLRGSGENKTRNGNP